MVGLVTAGYRDLAEIWPKVTALDPPATFWTVGVLENVRV
jgi:hypothetical protein